jgi:SAM-dependent methyltransferase
MTTAADTPQSHHEAQKFFDRMAEDYRKRSETRVYNVSSMSFRRRQDIVSELLKKTPAKGTVLDYGMGPAVFGPPATGHGLKYIGVDISPAMVKIAQDMKLPNAEFHVGDLDALSRFQSTADTVLLIGLIDYLQDPAEGLLRLSKCVKPGGRLILSFRNHYSLPRTFRNTLRTVWNSIRPKKKSEQTAFEAPVLENSFVAQRDFAPLLREAGFGDFEVRYLDSCPIYFNMSLPRPLWHFCKKVDEIFSCSALRLFCASGVLMAYNKK